MQGQREISTRSQSDEEFMLSTNSFANELSRYEHKFDSLIPKAEISRLEYSLRNALNMDEELINDFLATCDSILQRHDILAKTGISQPIDQRDISKRNEGETIVLELPYSNMECWQVSKFQKFFFNFLPFRPPQVFQNRAKHPKMSQQGSLFTFYYSSQRHILGRLKQKELVIQTES